MIKTLKKADFLNSKSKSSYEYIFVFSSKSQFFFVICWNERCFQNMLVVFAQSFFRARKANIDNFRFS